MSCTQEHVQACVVQSDFEQTPRDIHRSLTVAAPFRGGASVSGRSLRFGAEPPFRSGASGNLYNFREDCLPERKLAGVFFSRKMGRDVRAAQEGFIELAEAAATA
jgi:hypothetical protein